MKDNKLLIGITIVFVLAIGFLLLKLNSIQNITLPTATNISLLPILLTGLITGGLTCLAVQGGLLASTIAMQEETRLRDATARQGKNGNAVPILAFVGAKLVAYTVLGFLLGWFGSLFQLSLTAQILMQFFVIVFMLGTAGNILEIHPIFRYFAIQPPKFLTRHIRNQSKSRSLFAPLILGALTIFIPCGTTQAMMALAIGSGKPVMGALVMFAFILGTTPLFFILGYFATKVYQKGFTTKSQAPLMKIAAIALILLALFNLKNTLSLAGVNLNFNLGSQGQTSTQAITENPTIEFLQNGYSPTNISVKAGTTVKLNLKNSSGAGCIQSFVIPKLGIQKVVPLGKTEQIAFTAPADKGVITFMCGMGMYRGVINVL